MRDDEQGEPSLRRRFGRIGQGVRPVRLDEAAVGPSVPAGVNAITIQNYSLSPRHDDRFSRCQGMTVLDRKCFRHSLSKMRTERTLHLVPKTGPLPPLAPSAAPSPSIWRAL